jgi:hypothetical protein
MVKECFSMLGPAKLASAEWLKFKRIRRGLLLQRAFGGALAVVGERTLRRAQYAAIRPIGCTVFQLAAMMPEPRCAVGQAAFDAAIGVGSGEHGWFRSAGSGLSPVDLMRRRPNLIQAAAIAKSA